MTFADAPVNLLSKRYAWQGTLYVGTNITGGGCGSRIARAAYWRAFMIYMCPNKPDFVPSDWARTIVGTSDTVVDIEAAWKGGDLTCLLPDDHPVREEFHDTYGIVLPRPVNLDSAQLNEGDRVVVPEVEYAELSSLSFPIVKCVEWHPKDRPVEFPPRNQDD